MDEQEALSQLEEEFIEDEELEEQEAERRWMWLALLLLLISFCCLLSSSQWAIISRLNQSTILAEIRNYNQVLQAVEDNSDDDAVIAPVKPEIIEEATRDAQALLVTPDHTGPQEPEAIVFLPNTPTFTPLPPTPTNTPRPTFTLTPVPNAAPVNQTPTPIPTATPLPPGPPTSTPVPPSTPTATPPPSTNTPVTVGTATTTATAALPSTATASPTTVVISTATPLPTSTIEPTVTETIVVPTETATLIPEPTATPTDDPTSNPTATPIAGVIVAADNTAGANPDQVITYTHIMTNTGNSVDNFALSFVNSRGYPVGVESKSGSYSGPISLGPGENTPLTVTVTIAPQVPANITDTTFITATSGHNSGVFDSVTNTTTISRVVGVAIEADTRRAISATGTINYVHTITNTGNSADTFNITSLSSPGTFSATANPNSIPLGPYASTVLTVSVTAPNTADAVGQTTTTASSSINPTIQDQVVDTTPVIIPSLALNAAAGDGLVSLGWTPQASATSYTLEYSENGGPWIVLNNAIPGTSDRFYHTGVANGTTYRYQLSAYASGALLGYSNEVSATPNMVARYVSGCTASPAVVPNDSAECVTSLSAVNIISGSVTFADRVRINDGGMITLTLGAGVIDGPGYDLAYYAAPTNGSATETTIDPTRVEIFDGTNWVTVFNWDGTAGGTDNSNVDFAATDGDGEIAHEVVEANLLFAEQPPTNPPTSPNRNTGIAIDIGAGLPAGVHYSQIRITQPIAGGGTSNIDAIYRIN